jgi:regulator of sigma E protease
VSYVLAFLGFALLVILHEAGHFAAAKAVGMRVERFSLFFGPLLVKVRRGETEYGIGPIPLGGYVKITGMNPNEEIPPEVAHRAYFRQPVWKRIVVISAGPLVNLIIAFVMLWGIYAIHGEYVTVSRVAPIKLKAPAAGQLRTGDRILSVDGKTGDPEAIRRFIGNHHCAGAPTNGCRATTPAVLSVQRGGQRLRLALVPRYSAANKRFLIGFAFDDQLTKYTGFSGAGHSVDRMWFVTAQTVGVVGRLFDSKQRKQLSSVVGGYKATQQSFAHDVTTALGVLALISLSLGVINLFPFLPLDGGHIFWALAEKVRRKPIPFSVMERASVVGFMLVLIVFAIGLTNDIHRLSGPGFGVR